MIAPASGDISARRAPWRAPESSQEKNIEAGIASSGSAPATRATERPSQPIPPVMPLTARPAGPSTKKAPARPPRAPLAPIANDRIPDPIPTARAKRTFLPESSISIPSLERLRRR